MRDGCAWGREGASGWRLEEAVNCPKKLAEPGIVQGQRQAEQGWSIREVDAGGHPGRNPEWGTLGTLDHFSFLMVKSTFTYIMPLKKKITYFLFISHLTLCWVLVAARKGIYILQDIVP